MSTPLLTWASLVCLLLLIVIINSIPHQRNRRTLHHPRHIFTIGSEREEFFIPGDPDPNGNNDDEQDE